MEYRGYKIESDLTYSMYEIKKVGQGPVAAPLRGIYATVDLAKRFVDQYEDAKGATSAKKRSTAKN